MVNGEAGHLAKSLSKHTRSHTQSKPDIYHGTCTHMQTCSDISEKAVSNHKRESMSNPAIWQ